ncbi:MAG: NADH-quinone oxidoreductase subunit H [Mycobacteriaceae bacterium]
MVESLPVLAALGVPAVLGALALAAGSFSAALTARAAGTSVAPALADPVREGARLLLQQPRRVPGADLLLSRAGLLGLLAAAGLAGLVVPVGGHVVSDSSIGIVWFNAADIVVWVAFWCIGWGSNSSWGLVGGYRLLAQGLAYELPHMFALVSVAVGARSLRVGDVVATQSGLWFVVWMPVAFAAYLLAVLGFSTAGPFSAPVGADVAGGLGAELAGVDRALLETGRYSMLAVGAAAAVPLFLGGGAGPLLPGWAWWLVKTLLVLGGLVAARSVGPAVRAPRFTEQAWLWWLPATVLQTLVVAVVVL